MTPGPWVVYNAGDGGDTYIGTADGSVIVAEHVAEKDAAAIATLPDLVAALDGLFRHCAMIHKHWGDGSNQREADAAIESARAALAKARP